MPTYTDDAAAVDAVKNRLIAQFGSEYEANYTGGVDVVDKNEEPSESERAGNPYLLLDIADATQSDDWSAADDRMRAVTLNMVATANDFNGGRTGVANPQAVQRVMASDVETEFSTHYSAWSALGLFDVRTRFTGHSVDTGEDGAPIYRHSLQLTFVYEQS